MGHYRTGMKMDHEQATTTQAAERYILDELPPSEREAFEEHYFTCEECADAVRSGTLLAVNTKALAKEELVRPSTAGQVVDIRTRPERPAWRRFFGGIPIAAAAALVLGTLGFQNFVTIPRLQRQASAWSLPRPLDAVLLRAQSRSALPVVRATGHALALNVELNADHPRPSYSVTVRRISGPPLAQFSAAPSQDGILVIWLSPSMEPGEYEILVRDPDRSPMEAVHFPFQFER